MKFGERKTMEKIRVLTAGDSALLIQFEQRIGEDVNRRISATVKLLKMQQIEGIVDMIPAYASLLVQYNPLVIRYEEIYKRVSAIVKMDTKVESMEKKVWEIPVLYGGELGPDFFHVAEHAGISGEELIRLHSEKDYLVYMLGFLPGFTYLGGLEEKLHTPRLENPRVKIPAGSVGIGGSQTGVYPVGSPGGWKLIGRTPVKMYDPEKQDPILVQAGEYIHFYPITDAEYARISEAVASGNYSVQWHKEG